MKNIFILLCLFALPSLAQDTIRAKQTIKVLTSKPFHGRNASFQGDRKAAAYIATLFEEAKLKEIQGQRYQHFQYNTQVFTKKASLKINQINLKPAYDFIVDEVSSSGSGNYTIVHLDSNFFYGSNPTKHLANKNVVLAYDQKFYTALQDMPLSVIEQVYQCKAIIEYNYDKLTMGAASKALAPPIYKVLKNKQLNFSTGKCQFALTAQTIQNYSSQNVFGLIEGKSDSTIVLSAHYDHLGHLGSKTYFPGANDNASGIAMLTELAYNLSQTKPHYTIIFIAFGAEEAGLLGSKYFTEHSIIDLKKIKLVFNMDIMGSADESLTMVNGSKYETLFNQFSEINSKHKYIPKIVKRGEAANSDHYYFSKLGIPAVFVYSTGKVKNYHDVMDVANTIRYDAFKNAYQLIDAFIREQ
jgi:aminopeptidase YwaD